MSDLQPAVGSLWEHESGERRFVVYSYRWPPNAHGEDSHLRFMYATPTKEETQDVSLAHWHLWASKARRIA